MKARTKILAAISFAVLVICLIFFLMIYQPGAGTYVRADKLQDTPEKYVEFSLGQNTLPEVEIQRRFCLQTCLA